MGMKKSVKVAWVDALRSGVYKQGTGALGSAQKGDVHGYDDDVYLADCQTPLTEMCKYNCCLGVLTDLYVQATGKVPAKGNWTNPNLEPEVRDWAGLNENDPIVEVKGTAVKISMVNDGGIDFMSEVRVPKQSFSKIADIIEAQL